MLDTYEAIAFSPDQRHTCVLRAGFRVQVLASSKSLTLTITLTIILIEWHPPPKEVAHHPGFGE